VTARGSGARARPMQVSELGRAQGLQPSAAYAPWRAFGPGSLRCSIGRLAPVDERSSRVGAYRTLTVRAATFAPPTNQVNVVVAASPRVLTVRRPDAGLFQSNPLAIPLRQRRTFVFNR